MMKALTINENINTEALQQIIELIEQNNRSNGVCWADWFGGVDPEEAFEIELCDQGSEIIWRAIKSNGESLKADLPAVELAVWGQNFAGSFWDRAD